MPWGVDQIQNLMSRIIQLSAGFAFIALLMMLLYAGIRFLVSGGEAKGLQAASATVTWALLGMLFLILVWLILKLIEVFTGVEVTKFCLGFPPFCQNIWTPS